MSEHKNERKAPDRRDYHRRWRAEHPEKVKAAQMRYWTKKAQANNQSAVEIRTAEENLSERREHA